jgi:hypothetical protein
MVIVQPWFQHFKHDPGCNSTRITSVGQFLLFQRKNWQIKVVRYLYEPLSNSSPTSKTQFGALTDGSPKS